MQVIDSRLEKWVVLAWSRSRLCIVEVMHEDHQMTRLIQDYVELDLIPCSGGNHVGSWQVNIIQLLSMIH